MDVRWKDWKPGRVLRGAGAVMESDRSPGRVTASACRGKTDRLEKSLPSVWFRRA